MSRLTQLAKTLPGYSAAKRAYQSSLSPLLAAAFHFERRRIEAELGERMDAVMQPLHRRQEEMETDLLRLRQTVERLDAAQTRAELDDIKRDIRNLVEALSSETS